MSDPEPVELKVWFEDGDWCAALLSGGAEGIGPTPAEAVEELFQTNAAIEMLSAFRVPDGADDDGD